MRVEEAIHGNTREAEVLPDLLLREPVFESGGFTLPRLMENRRSGFVDQCAKSGFISGVRPES